jgi:hypothetical protein
MWLARMRSGSQNPGGRVVKPSRKVTLSQWTVKVHAIPNAGRAASCNTPAPELHIIFSFTLPSASGREVWVRVRVRVSVRANC